MINLAIAIAAALAAYALTGFALGGGGFQPWYGILPALAVLIGLYLYLMRRTMSQVEAIMKRAESDLMAVQQQVLKNPPKTPQQQQALQAKFKDASMQAIETMKQALPLSRWQFLVEQQVNGQIGTLLFLNQESDKAEPWLRASFVRMWMPQAMLAVILYKRQAYDEMDQVFEKTAKVNAKESMLWATWAWCMANKTPPDVDKAIGILARARTEGQMDDPRINENLEALQNGKKMKMDGWKELWYQLQLEKPKMPKVAANPYQQFGGRVSRRALRG